MLMQLDIKPAGGLRDLIIEAADEGVLFVFIPNPDKPGSAWWGLQCDDHTVQPAWAERFREFDPEIRRLWNAHLDRMN